MRSELEQARLHVSRSTDALRKAEFGQFLTPEHIGAFMASLFPPAGTAADCRLLDPGAGIGSLSAAFLERWRSGDFGFRTVRVDAFEIDRTLHQPLAQTFARFRSAALVATIHDADFVASAVEALTDSMFSRAPVRYSHAILNPPYKKIGSASPHRLALRSVGIETVNLYSAFVALAIELLEPGGHLVAIVPRSFCNGPYYRPFRKLLLDRTAIRRMHLFESRSKAFGDDDVLQENLIIHLERSGSQGPVTISTSTDDSFADLRMHLHPFERVVLPNDSERFIHVPTSPDPDPIEAAPAICHALSDLGVGVATGPVVDFRLREHLRQMPASDTAPLLYPCHVADRRLAWPIETSKKPNAIARNEITERWLYPNGFYCVVRRFSAKEEERRIVASVVEPAVFGAAPLLGFENHLNVFHANRSGLPEALARGLETYLNSTAVDRHFRRFNGHTQVNATDLRLIPYPSRDTLVRLGKWAKRKRAPSQREIDAKLGELIA